MALRASALDDLTRIFEENFRERGELGASVCVWHQGEELLALDRGWRDRERHVPWTPDTLAPVYSATKAPAAATLLHALESRGLDEDTPVREVWRHFPVADACFYHLLSHQCGLATLDRRVSVFDHDAVVAAIEAQPPAWTPGDGHGYHPRTFGTLVDHPVRLLTGHTLGDWWRRHIARPLGLDFWIGLPEQEHDRVAMLVPGKAEDASDDAFYRAFNTADSMTRRAFASPQGLHAVHEMNHPEAWSAGLPAIGGIGSARALAKFYQAAIGAIESPLSLQVRQALGTSRSSADDRVLLRPTTFTCGAQLDPTDADGRKLREINGPSLTAFGHPGAGGSHGFGDPSSGISFAYVMNQMNLGVMPGIKCLAMVHTLSHAMIAAR
jgi:CubicO group peptidase (beta-lactamase class C family)